MSEDRTPKRSAKEQFDRQAGHYNAQWSTWSEESLKWLLDNAEIDPSDAVLDVATGTGFTALAFAPHVRSVVGVDVSTGMLEQARNRAENQNIRNVTFVEGAAELLPSPDASFDIVTCRIAPHHFLSMQRFLFEVVRVLKPGGRFVVADTSVPNGQKHVDIWQNRVETLRDPSHVRNYTSLEWQNFVNEAGLAVEQVNEKRGIPIELNDWLTRAGCSTEQCAAVRTSFEQAPEGAVQAFRIVRRPDGDIHFIWRRVVLKARKT